MGQAFLSLLSSLLPSLPPTLGYRRTKGCSSDITRLKVQGKGEFSDTQSFSEIIFRELETQTISIKKMDLEIRHLEKSYKSIPDTLPGAKPETSLRAPGCPDRDAEAAGMRVFLS